MKTNIEESFYKETNSVGFWIIARDEILNVPLASSQVKFVGFDAEEAELLVFREALLFAMQWIPHLYNLSGPNFKIC